VWGTQHFSASRAYRTGDVAYAGRCKATCKRGFKLPWREAGPPNYHDDKVDSDQEVVNTELSLGGQAKETAQLFFLCAPVLFIYGLCFSELGCLTTLHPQPQTLNPPRQVTS